MMGSNVLSPENSLLPPNPLVLSDEEILEYFPYVGAIGIEQLKLDLMVVTEILFKFAQNKKPVSFLKADRFNRSGDRT